MLYTMIVLTVFSLGILLVNIRNRYAWYLALMALGLDLSVFSLLLHITRILTYRYPLISLFNYDYSMYLLASGLKFGYYEAIHFLNFGVVLFMLSLHLTTREFTKSGARATRSKSLLSTLLFVAFLLYFAWFYSPAVGYRLYVAAYNSLANGHGRLFTAIRIADLLNYLIVAYYLFWPIVMVARASRQYRTFLWRRQTAALAVSLLILNAFFVLIFVTGPLRTVYFALRNPAEMFLYFTASIRMPLVFYQVIPPAMLVLVIFIVVLLVRSHILDFGSKFKESIISRKMKEFNKSIGGVFHSYKNTLFRMKILLDQLKNEYGTERGYGILERIGTINDLSLSYMTKTLDSLREIRIHPRINDITECIESAVQRIEQDDGIAIRCEFQTRPINGMVDRYHMTEALHAVFNNAVEAFEDASTADKIITIDARQERNWNIVDISDNAVGIDRKSLKKVFHPFYSTKTSRGNLGIGLAYVSRIVKMHLGMIHVESVLNDHTTFQILLPRH